MTTDTARRPHLVHHARDDEVLSAGDAPDATTRRQTRVLAALALLAGLAAVLPAASAPAARPQPSVQISMPDTGLAVSSLVAVVRDAARGVPGSLPDRDIEIVFVGEIPGQEDQPLLAGLQRGATVWVRVDGTAMPTRSLVHELTHLVVPDDSHGAHFREIYLAAIAEVYDEATARREARRFAWVYDACYRDSSCPAA
jgi:hypothetical protein